MRRGGGEGGGRRRQKRGNTAWSRREREAWLRGQRGRSLCVALSVYLCLGGRDWLRLAVHCVACCRGRYNCKCDLECDCRCFCLALGCCCYVCVREGSTDVACLSPILTFHRPPNRHALPRVSLTQGGTYPSTYGVSVRMYLMYGVQNSNSEMV